MYNNICPVCWRKQNLQFEQYVHKLIAKLRLFADDYVRWLIGKNLASRSSAAWAMWDTCLLNMTPTARAYDRMWYLKTSQTL